MRIPGSVVACVVAVVIAGCGSKGSKNKADDKAGDGETKAGDDTPTQTGAILPAKFAAHYELPASPAAAALGAELYVVVTADRIGAAAVPKAGVKTPLGGGLPGKPVKADELTRQIEAYQQGRELIGGEDELGLAQGKMGARPPEDPRQEEEKQEEEDDYESGGTGTAMTLEEGRMGKPDPVRETGQYQIRNKDGSGTGSGVSYGTDRFGTSGGRTFALTGIQISDQPPVVLCVGAGLMTGGWGSGGGPTGAGAASSVVGVQLGDDGIYQIDERGRTELGKAGDADTAALDTALGNAASAGNDVQLWILVDPRPSVSDLALVLDAAHRAKLSRAYLATMADWRTHYTADVFPIGGDTNGNRRGGPTVEATIGQASATGDLDKDIIRRYVRRKMPRIKYCYEQAALDDPSLAGTVVTNFTIDAKGAVKNLSARGMNSAVSSCVGEAIESIQFPKPQNGRDVDVSYPFIFRMN